jgi:hypothetical protein
MVCAASSCGVHDIALSVELFLGLLFETATKKHLEQALEKYSEKPRAWKAGENFVRIVFVAPYSKGSRRGAIICKFQEHAAAAAVSVPTYGTFVSVCDVFTRSHTLGLS